jgi:hypothetical protein
MTALTTARKVYSAKFRVGTIAMRHKQAVR